MEIAEQYSICEMAQVFGVSLRTLRFYEQRGILEPTRIGHTRVYDPKDRVRLQIILKGKRLGFSLSEIERLLRKQESPHNETLPLSQDQIERQIKQLVRQKEKVEGAILELKRAFETVAA